MDWVIEVIRDHWPSLLFWAVGIGLGAWWGRRRARRQWLKKEYLDRLNVSLNMITDGTLRIRTVLEKNLLEVLLNRVAVEKVMEAAARATEASPILPLAKEDAWYILNSVLNEISERFAVGTMQQDLHADVLADRYLVCLTYEVAGAVRTRKVRAMLVKKSLLDALPDEMPKLESPNHSTRWETLRRMATAWKQEPHHFLEMEIAV